MVVFGLVVDLFAATSAGAQVATPSSLVSVCSGVTLPRSVVTSIVSPVLTGIYGPIETDVNGLLTGVSSLVPGLPAPLSVNVNGLLATAASGSNISLSVVSQNGTLVGPSSQCDAVASSYTLGTPAGIALGGNSIGGLGASGQFALAGEINSIAVGNRAATAIAALNSIAIGPDANVGATGVGSVALGSAASVNVANSVALGAGSAATRGPALGVSVGEVSIGAPGAARQLTNVAGGSALTDAVNFGQLQAVAAAIPANAVSYDGASHTIATLTGAGGTTLTNVAPGALSVASTDAVNGSQLFATNQQVVSNTTAISNLTVLVGSGSGTPVAIQYSNAGSPSVPNGGVPSNDTTLVGAVAGAVGLHNVAAGTIAAGSTDAVNGGQVFAVAAAAQNAVQYQTNVGGTRTNTVVLVGGNVAAPVTITNVAAGAVAAGSTDAVNGSQLNIVQLAADQAQVTATQALTLNQNAVTYDSSARTSVTMGNAGSPVAVHNVAAGTAATDAANVGQLNGILGAANAYTDASLSSLRFDLRGAQREARAGTAAALAAAALPQPITAGGGMISAGVGTYRGRSAFALGASKVTPNGRVIMKASLTYDASSHVGANAGVGFGF